MLNSYEGKKYSCGTIASGSWENPFVNQRFFFFKDREWDEIWFYSSFSFIIWGFIIVMGWSFLTNYLRISRWQFLVY